MKSNEFLTKKNKTIKRDGKLAENSRHFGSLIQTHRSANTNARTAIRAHALHENMTCKLYKKIYFYFMHFV